MVACPLLPWTTSFIVAVDSCYVHYSLPFVTSDQVQGVGYFKSKVQTDVAALELETGVAAIKLETDVAALKLETDATALKLETDTFALDL
jgi:hypothetical protein